MKRNACLLLLLTVALAGCQSRTATVSTVPGAVVGAVPPPTEDKRSRELREAYERGMSQTAKADYWIVQRLQSQSTARAERTEDAGSVYLPIVAPERRVNGVIVNATTEYIRTDKP